MTIFIGNLSRETDVEDLEQLFSNYGVVKKCYLPLYRETGRKRGFAFVDLNEHNSEKKLLMIFKMLNGCEERLGLMRLKKETEPKKNNNSNSNN